MAITSSEAIQQLINNSTAYSTKESLLGLLDQVSIEATGKVTVFIQRKDW